MFLTINVMLKSHVLLCLYKGVDPVSRTGIDCLGALLLLHSCLRGHNMLFNISTTKRLT